MSERGRGAEGSKQALALRALSPRPSLRSRPRFLSPCAPPGRKRGREREAATVTEITSQPRKYFSVLAHGEMELGA